MKENIEIKRVTLPLSKLEMNNGQLEGLPKNPRQWTRAELDKLAKSLEGTPELLQMRCPIVAPLEGGKYITLGGNMRLAALRESKAKEVECFVVEGADAAKLREIVIKDNGSFGEWDWDELANQWDEALLDDANIDFPKAPEIKETEKLSGLEYDSMYYEPVEKPRLTLEQCVDRSKFNAKMAAIDESPLPDDKKDALRMFAWRFLRIDYEAVANYYAFCADDEERKVIERLRLVLVDNGSVDGFIEDNLIRVADVLNEEIYDND